MHLAPIGFENPCVYCFMNACLQCLLSIPEFNYYFANKVYKMEKKSKKSQAQDACEAMYDLIHAYNNCTKTSMMATRTIYDVCYSFLPRNQQHDSHVRLLLNISNLNRNFL